MMMLLSLSLPSQDTVRKKISCKFYAGVNFPCRDIFFSRSIILILKCDFDSDRLSGFACRELEVKPLTDLLSQQQLGKRMWEENYSFPRRN